MTVHLRGHHLLCMLTWKGHGYTPEFTKNYDQLIGRIMNEGAAIQIIDGPDDICKPLDPKTTDNYHCDCAKELERDKQAINDINIFFEKNNLPIWRKSEDIFLTADILKLLRAAFKKNEIRSACVTCSFYNFCTDIAEENFKDTRLKLS